MIRSVDLICTAGHVEKDVLTDDPFAACPECGAPRRTWWGGGKSPGVHVFQPVYHEGVGMIASAADLKVAQHTIAKAQGCKPEDIVINRQSKAEVRTVADEHRQRAHDRNKKKGLDRQRINEIREGVRRTGINPHNGMKAKPAPLKPLEKT